jgi:hypothetical protein
MLSECARAASVEEVRFRVDYPNSLARRIAIVALDRPAEDAIRRLAQKRWNAATFMTTARHERSRPIGDRLRDLSGEGLNLLDQIGAADVVVTVSIAGESGEDAAVVAEACGVHRVMMTALLIDPASAPETSVLATMKPLRAHAAMLVVAKGEEYVEAMLTAMRA